MGCFDIGFRYWIEEFRVIVDRLAGYIAKLGYTLIAT